MTLIETTAGFTVCTRSTKLGSAAAAGGAAGVTLGVEVSARVLGEVSARWVGFDAGLAWGEAGGGVCTAVEGAAAFEPFDGTDGEDGLVAWPAIVCRCGRSVRSP